MALARRRCYSIERLLRGLRQILPPFPSCSLSSSVSSSSSSSSTFSHPPPLVGVAAASHTRARKGREGKRRENRFLSFCRSRRRPSVSVLSLQSLLVTRRRPPPSVVPGWRHPPPSLSPPRGVEAARGPLCLSLLLLLPLLRASPLSRRGEESAVIRGRPLSILSH